MVATITKEKVLRSQGIRIHLKSSRCNVWAKLRWNAWGQLSQTHLGLRKPPMLVARWEGGWGQLRAAVDSWHWMKVVPGHRGDIMLLGPQKRADGWRRTGERLKKLRDTRKKTWENILRCFFTEWSHTKSCNWKLQHKSMIWSFWGGEVRRELPHERFHYNIDSLDVPWRTEIQVNCCSCCYLCWGSCWVSRGNSST